MGSLSREHRSDLARVVARARKVAETGARQALESLAVHHHEPWSSMNAEARKLRNRLRAHGRQLGDRFDQKRGTQGIDRLVQECAYEHWHRMLFSRFLAECDLLIEPDSGVAISLDECRELAAEQQRDWLSLATEFAVRMLPQIFRTGDPVLEVTLTPEIRHELEGLLKSLLPEIFLADDSLGWVYQFWQAEKKDEVNASGNKIGAAELPAVTQLFTEDYMVDFLLHNTLGAWWSERTLAGKVTGVKSEEDVRRFCALPAMGNVPGIDWKYLRFIHNEDGVWRPASGTFVDWPKTVEEIRLLDPCMGSGHFLVVGFLILVRLRMEEQNLSAAKACVAVLQENVFGLELDLRCTQIAAFNLALVAWKLGGYQVLPTLNLACSGLGVNANETNWLKIAGDNEKLQTGMQRLYQLFRQAPILGSLINPRALGGDLLVAEFLELRPLLERMLEAERADDAHEIAVTAQGVAKAAEILAGQFTLVSTNVPYLGREGHTDTLISYGDAHASDASADLATLMLHRCLQFTGKSGTIAVVLPQNWWVGKAYSHFRGRILKQTAWRLAVVLGEEAWQAFGNRGPNTILLALDAGTASESNAFYALDVSTKPGTPVVNLETKAKALTGEQDTDELKRLSKLMEVRQWQLAKNKDARISVAPVSTSAPLSASVISGEGCSTGDSDRFLRRFWELSNFHGWLRYAGPGFEHWDYCDNSLMMWWEDGRGELARSDQARIQNTELWKNFGILIGRVRGITATLFSGGCFSKGAVLLCPREQESVVPLYAFLKSKEFENQVRTIDPRVSAATSVLTDVPFDLAHWKKVAAEKYPTGLPKPFSSDPTQLRFSGHPRDSDQPLQVAVARVVGYRWPRQTGSSFPDCPELTPDDLDKFADGDGIVSLDSLRGELPAADRIRALLGPAFGENWSPAKQNDLLMQVSSRSIEDWLREKFFEQHCSLFHQVPFVWHIWDGLKKGFNVLVDYQILVAPNGEGRRNLEKLIFTYLGRWIEQQKADQKNGVDGADLKLAAAEHLKKELEHILHGEPPYDIFVRWKPLHEQPIGWEPDINDGVRINIRPFLTARPLNAKAKNASILRVTPNIKWDKDRGKEPNRDKEDFPWFWSWDQQTQDFAGDKIFDGNRWNNLHYTRAFKEQARRARRQAGGAR